LDVAFVERCKLYYKGEGDGFPQVWAVVNLVSSSLPVVRSSLSMVRPNTKNAQIMH
jgi:hypothetical protein